MIYHGVLALHFMKVSKCIKKLSAHLESEAFKFRKSYLAPHSVVISTKMYSRTTVPNPVPWLKVIDSEDWFIGDKTLQCVCVSDSRYSQVRTLVALARTLCLHNLKTNHCPVSHLIVIELMSTDFCPRRILLPNIFYSEKIPVDYYMEGHKF